MRATCPRCLKLADDLRKARSEAEKAASGFRAPSDRSAAIAGALAERCERIADDLTQHALSHGRAPAEAA